MPILRVTVNLPDEDKDRIFELQAKLISLHKRSFSLNDVIKESLKALEKEFNEKAFSAAD